MQKKILLLLLLISSFAFSQNIDLVYPGDGLSDLPVRIKFKWLHDVAYQKYEIEFDTLSDFSSSAERLVSNVTDYSALNTGDTIAQQDSNFYFGKKYYWRIRGINGNVSSSWTAAQSFTTRYFPLLTSPVDGSILTSFNVLFRCEAIVGATQYRFQGGNTNVFISPIYNNVITTSTYNTPDKSSLGYWVNSITTNGDYYVRVKAISDFDSSAWSNTAKFTFEVSNEIEEIHIADDALYPNPTIGNLNIKHDGVTQLLVFNMQGKEVMRYNASPAIKTIDVSPLSDGMYQIMMFSGNTIYAQKINVLK